MEDIVEEKKSPAQEPVKRRETRSMRRSRSRSRSPDIGKTATSQTGNKKGVSVRDKLKALRK